MCSTSSATPASAKPSSMCTICPTRSSITQPRARGCVIDDLVGQIVHIDDGFADAGVAELVEHMIEQRAARDAHQRLWHPVRQGAHAHAKSGGEDHGFEGLDGHFRNFSDRYSWIAQI